MVRGGHRMAAAMLLLLLPAAADAQERLVPAATRSVPPQSAAKAAAAAVELPFFDDFSAQEACLSPRLWEQGGATVGNGFGQHPPTVGMMSLDALDSDGRLYAAAGSALFAADTALSRRIRLDRFRPADSVVMSFYYLPGGGSGNLWERVGDAPDTHDSLFLDFYNGTSRQWQTVWRRGGTCVDTLVRQTGRQWQYVSVSIADPAYFDSTFRFRFRNYCSLEDNGKNGFMGNSDQWNIDYVVVDASRTTAGEPAFHDVAFVEPAPTMLAHYRAMPARQYRPQEMASALRMTITNLHTSALASRYSYAVVSDRGDTLHRYDGGFENAPPYLPGGSYQTAATHAEPSVDYSFPQRREPCRYEVVHVVREGASGDDYRQNDTVRYVQLFANYYAYDDGTAENGYGLTSTADSVYLAYRFDLNEPDTLAAVDLYFNHTPGQTNEQVGFYLTVWESAAGRPGRILYRDRERRRAHGTGYSRYVLEHDVVASGSIFVGFTQAGNDYINIGFDRSFNTADRICYLTSVNWQQSILSGSLMLRPVFGHVQTVGVGTAAAQTTLSVSPNPVVGRLTVEGVPEGGRVTLWDIQGRLRKTVVAAGGKAEVPMGDCPAGVYILKAGNTVKPVIKR